ncbi:hypothetical protein J1605_004502 [Eschrichtius robustus]|uniref:Uncharacterized protein n=1 Tax=Eschrichtius robustus TaxID=9764 RepID=A0AB34HGA9_ESCRO|nr:hypothetical protein J1605_004502 [Eschrichtius robustus]
MQMLNYGLSRTRWKQRDDLGGQCNHPDEGWWWFISSGSSPKDIISTTVAEPYRTCFTAGGSKTSPVEQQPELQQPQDTVSLPLPPLPHATPDPFTLYTSRADIPALGAGTTSRRAAGAGWAPARRGGAPGLGARAGGESGGGAPLRRLPVRQRVRRAMSSSLEVAQGEAEAGGRAAPSSLLSPKRAARVSGSGEGLGLLAGAAWPRSPVVGGLPAEAGLAGRAAADREGSAPAAAPGLRARGRPQSGGRAGDAEGWVLGERVCGAGSAAGVAVAALAAAAAAAAAALLVRQLPDHVQPSQRPGAGSPGAPQPGPAPPPAPAAGAEKPWQALPCPRRSERLYGCWEGE